MQAPGADGTEAVADEAEVLHGPPLPALASADLVYALYYGPLSRDAAVAEAHFSIRVDAGRYRLSTEGRAIGLVAMFYSGTLTQSSEGRLGAQGLQPEHYREQRGRRPQRQLRFDPDRRIMLGNGDPPEVPMPAGTQDRLSVYFQLGLLARGRPALMQPGRRFHLPLASMRAVDRPTFTVVGAESQKTPLGALDCLRVTVRNEADPGDPVFDIWLATGHRLWPARIRMTEANGKVIDQILQRYS